MPDERLSDLCVISVHREKIRKDMQGFIKRVMDRFGREFRRLQLLFLTLTCLASWRN